MTSHNLESSDGGMIDKFSEKAKQSWREGMGESHKILVYSKPQVKNFDTDAAPCKIPWRASEAISRFLY